MKTVDIQAAETQLSRLVEEAVQGEEIILAKAGRPMVVLSPIDETTVPRKGGRLKMTLGDIPEDFDESSPEIEALFEG